MLHKRPDFINMTKEDLIHLLQESEVITEKYGADGMIQIVHGAMEGIDLEVESFIVCAINAESLPLGYLKITSGKRTEQASDMDYVVKKVLSIPNAEGIIFLHNHPVGSLNPTKADIKALRAMIAAFMVVGIKVIDSIIFNSTSYYSLRENDNKIMDEFYKKYNEYLDGNIAKEIGYGGNKRTKTAKGK